MKHSFMVRLVHFPYFSPPKWEKQRPRSCAVGPKMVPFCCFAPLNCVSFLLPIHPGWEPPLHYSWLCIIEARPSAQHEVFFEKTIGGTMGLLSSSLNGRVPGGLLPLDGGPLGTFCPQKLLHTIDLLPVHISVTATSGLEREPGRFTLLPALTTLDWSSPGCQMLGQLRREGGWWLFAPRWRVIRHLLPIEAPIIERTALTPITRLTASSGHERDTKKLHSASLFSLLTTCQGLHV